MRAVVVAPALLCSWVLAVAPRIARADDAGSSSALAETLFRDGRALMEAGRFREACPKLADSERIDPHLGTLLNLAACHELEGRTATAWAEYTDARSQAEHAGRADRESFARERARALEARLSRVVITAEAPADGLQLSIDGETLHADVLGAALPVDPGRHQLRASAPGRVPWSSSFDAPPGPATQTLHVPALARAPAAAAPPPPSQTATATTPPTATVAPAPDTSSHGPRALFWTLSAVAVAGIGAGTYFGLDAMAKNSDAAHACNAQNQCPAGGLDLDRQARSAATLSNVAFGVALAASVGAVVVLAIGGRSSDASQVSLGPTGIAWRGRW